MEISEVRKRVLGTIDRARRQAAERKTRNDAAERAYERFLQEAAVPIFRQVATVLKAEGVSLSVFTPAASVRLMSDRRTSDYIELTLDTDGPEPFVKGHTSRAWGNRVVEAEEALGDPASLTEDDVLAFLLTALEPLLGR
jgi:hypothetical protein